MARVLVGVLLLPLSATLVWSAALALAAVAAGAAAAPFLSGIGLVAAVWLMGWGRRPARWAYVLGHELTHALAAWASGGKVFSIQVREDGGHVDSSESGAVVALAPYVVPFHALLVVAGYRLLTWLRPGVQAEALFLLLMGAALAFHGLMTWETLTQARQPDLDAAGGALFSLAWIAAVNALVVLLLLKALFPETVALGAALSGAGCRAWRVWAAAGSAVAPAARAAWRWAGR